jgi:hypothetical protein
LWLPSDDMYHVMIIIATQQARIGVVGKDEEGHDHSTQMAQTD